MASKKTIAAMSIKVGADISQMTKGMNKANKQLSGFGNSVKRFGGLLAGAFAINAIKNFVQDSVKLFDIQAKSEAKVANLLVSTNKAAGKSMQELKKAASDLQNNTLFGDETILNDVTAQFLTFTNISGDTFERAQKSALDLTTVLDSQLKGTAIQLGKALNDPVKGISALAKSGIQFTQSQKETIKSLADTNQLAEAQALILTELEKQYGGAAEAAAKAGLGPFQQFQNTLGDIQEFIGEKFIPAINEVAKFFTNLFTGDNAFTKAASTLSKVFGDIGDALGQLFAEFGTNGGDVITEIFAAIINSISKSIFILKTLVQTFTGVVRAFKVGVNEIGKAFTDTFDGIGDLIDGVFEFDVDKIAKANEKISNAFTGVGDAIGAAFLSAFETTEIKDKIEENLLKNPINVPVTITPTTGSGQPVTKEGTEEGRGIQIDEESNRKIFELTTFMQQLNAEFDLAANKSTVFGESFDILGEQTKLYENAINSLLENGFAPTSEAIVNLQNKLNELQTPFNQSVEMAKEFGNVLTDTFAAVGEGFTAFANVFLKGVKEIIVGYIAQAISASILKNIGTFGPVLGPILAGASIGIVKGLFNAIPEFAEGGAVTSPTLAMVGEKSGSKGEAIIPFEKLPQLFNKMGFGGGDNSELTNLAKERNNLLKNKKETFNIGNQLITVLNGKITNIMNI